MPYCIAPSRAVKVDQRLCGGYCVMPLVERNPDLINRFEIDGIRDADHVMWLRVSLKGHASCVAQPLQISHTW